MWQKKRLKIIERDGFKCKCCSSDYKQLHVHHLSYKEGVKAWEYEDDNFVTLCDNCHKSIHEVNEWIDSKFLKISVDCLKTCSMTDYYLKDLSYSFDAAYNSPMECAFDYIENGALIFESIFSNRTFVLTDLIFDKEKSIIWINSFYDAK